MQISLRLGLAFLPGIGYNDNCFRDVAQVVERYFREVEAAGSSPVIPIVLLQRNAIFIGIPFLFYLEFSWAGLLNKRFLLLQFLINLVSNYYIVPIQQSNAISIVPVHPPKLIY